jgi:hypothetical protein
MRLVAAAVVWAAVAAQVAAIQPPRAELPDPWVITSPVVIDEPALLGDVIVVGGGSLRVTGVADPGLQLEGSLWVVGDGELVLEDSVVQFLSTYHGQYALAVAEQARARVTGCDYRVPYGVQHALVVAGSAELTVEDTDFGDAQLIAAENSTLVARRLTGNFEVIVQNAATMALADIPRELEQGSLWVWVEFGPGSDAQYSPPPPGWVESWRFPPAGAAGIPQTIEVERCVARLWPMLVREGSRLELADIDESNWVVVGLHLPTDAAIAGLHNNRSYADTTLPLTDRVLRLVDASVDTWNLYPQADARVLVNDSTLGEILAMGESDVVVRGSTIDGSGGFFGARDRSRIDASDCRITCTVEAAHQATVELHTCEVLPHPTDPTGARTRFGAYDRGRLLADQTPVMTVPGLGGEGLIAVSYLVDPPERPPGASGAVELWGIAAQYSLSDAMVPGRWRLEASPAVGDPVVLAEGDGNVEEDVLGVWSRADPRQSYLLRVVLTDRSGRELSSRLFVRGEQPVSPEVSEPRR